MVARLSFTDFDGESFMNSTSGTKKLDDVIIKKNAPNIVEGVSRLKAWSETL